MCEEKPKKKFNPWNIGILVLVLIFCILIWEGFQVYYFDWKQEIYDTGYNQSRIDTLLAIAQQQGNTGNIIFIENNTVTARNIRQLCGVDENA
ncbi:hypothetical protein LCGC14_2322180 [marine sediment metagenome]|uniref:Uncharacterized protein n=1 Tax=marine sediment metagenome TaxID=412755 RepID=A0A0F9CI43_9ZZZZ